MRFSVCEMLLPSYERNQDRPEQEFMSCGRAVLSPSGIAALHCHRDAEMGICCGGSGSNYIKNRIYRFQAGDFQFVPAGVPHYCVADPGEPCSWIWITADLFRFLSEDGSRYLEPLRAYSAKCFCGMFHAEEHPYLASLIQRYCYLNEHRDAYFEMSCAFLAGETLTEVARIGDVDGDQLPNRVSTYGRLKPAVQYIREHYRERDAMRVDAVAAVAGLSPSHFRALFKREAGITVQEFILRTRLASAEYLLQATNQSVLEIALASGFGEISYFNRAFRKHYRRSPRECRRGAAGAVTPCDCSAE